MVHIDHKLSVIKYIPSFHNNVCALNVCMFHIYTHACSYNTPEMLDTLVHGLECIVDIVSQ